MKIKDLLDAIIGRRLTDEERDIAEQTLGQLDLYDGIKLASLMSDNPQHGAEAGRKGKE